MGGGLIELTSKGTEELYLTGSPQITFFKTIYRRYTNFAIETITQRFIEDSPDFGKTLTCILDKNGDLVHKIYLAIELPEVQFTIPLNQDEGHQTKEDIAYQVALNEYNIVDTFTTYNITLYKQAITKIQPHNPESLGNALVYIQNNITALDPTGSIKNNFKQLLNQCGSCDAVLRYYQNTYIVDIITYLAIYSSSIDPNTIDLVQIINDQIKNYNVTIHREYFCRLQQALVNKKLANGQLELNRLASYSKFAWVKRIGHAIIDLIDIEIGGQRIDRQYGDWINIWWELTHSEFQKQNYMKMIGNVCELTTFDQCKKPSYRLTIPIPFWFAKYSGLALPLISLNYYDVTLRTRLRNIEECCYTDINGVDMLDTIHLRDAYFLVDYVFLDRDERTRFAQVVHEYLIEQVQRMEFIDFNKKENNFELVFVNPIKEMVWIYQRNDFVKNPDGMTECQFYNYTLNPYSDVCQCCCTRIDRDQCFLKTCCCNILPQYLPSVAVGCIQKALTNFNYTDQLTPPTNTPGNPINQSVITLQGYQLGPILIGAHTNYIYPFTRHTHTPADGINIYPFGFKPEEHQPSGTCNMGRIGSVNLNVTFTPDILNKNLDGKFRVYCLNYNILRFISGMAGCAFTIT